MIVGMSIGVNMQVKADPRLWVSVSPKYSGFVFKPTKGWLDNGTTQTEQKHNRRDGKTSGSSRGLQTTSTNVRS